MRLAKRVFNQVEARDKPPEDPAAVALGSSDGRTADQRSQSVDTGEAI